MASVLNLNPALAAARIDQRVCLHGVSWQDFEALLAMRGDNGAVRVSYLEGARDPAQPSRVFRRSASSSGSERAAPA